VFNPTFEINCALLVDRLAGLRSAEQLSVDAAADRARPPFVGERYRDNGGRTWQELNLAALANDDAFMRIVD